MLLHLSFTIPQSYSEEGNEGDSRDPAPCVARQGRGAGAFPAPGMRARVLASTSLSPVLPLEPPLADSGERECAGQPSRPARGPGAAGNVSREAATLLGVSPAPGVTPHRRHAARCCFWGEPLPASSMK